MAALSPDRPPFDVPLMLLSGAAIVLAVLALSLGDGSPEAKDRSEASRPAALGGGAISPPVGVTGPATRLIDRLHAVPRQPFGRLPSGEATETSEVPPAGAERAGRM